jgi:N-glycosylase/DNA lyase
MDFTKVEEIKDGIIVKDIKNFDLTHIFECGQCFRWTRVSRDNYIGVAYNKVIELEKKDQDLIIYNTNLQDFNLIWRNYFDIDREYKPIKDSLSGDPLLKKAVEFGHGIRILSQEPFELIISFIISSNNRIPMIKKVIENICYGFGKKLEYKGKIYYGFPNIEKLHLATLEELKACSAGFRAKYIYETTKTIFENQGLIDSVLCLSDDDCHLELQKLNGIGPKVADCIMLFSMAKYSAFPVDVWVKRAMQTFYLAPEVSLKGIRAYGRNKFGCLSGFAQQYLFYYARENNIKI